ncbi:hypothetical protein, partial [Salmonella sp. s51944]|uniref:hypothetical protein n=1 Tax=Salmonella sp. s51944 TaxID=3159655 RepID=UPI00398155F7
ITSYLRKELWKGGVLHITGLLLNIYNLQGSIMFVNGSKRKERTSTFEVRGRKKSILNIIV